MSCNNTFPWTETKCRKSIGGIKKIYAINKNNVEFIHYDDSNTDMINFILPAQNDNFKEVHFIKDSASLTTTFVGDTTTGSGEYTSELVFKINEDFYFIEMGDMENIPVLFVIQNYKDEYYCLGDKTPAYLTNGVHSTGASLGEFNGEELTFTSASDKPLHKCIVGSELAGEEGTFLYISENILKHNSFATYIPKEVDSGELVLGRGVSWDDSWTEGFGVEIPFDQDTELAFSDPEFIMLDVALGDYQYMIKDGSRSSIKFSDEVVTQAQNLAEETGEEIVLTKKYRQYVYGNQFEKLTLDFVLVNWTEDWIAVTWDSNFSNAEMMQFDISVSYRFYPNSSSAGNRPTIVVYVENPIAISGLK